MRVSPTARAGETTTEILAFLIADIRGYSTFNRERGDADAAKLASRFAEIARDAVEARAGRVVELRGDEVLAVFSSPSQAVRASVELQAACAEETADDPTLPMPIGIGIDAGPAVPVDDGYRGVAINMAARLCAKAGAGEVLITDTFAAACANPDRITYTEAGTFEFKGFADPVAVVAAMMAATSLAPTKMLPVARDPLPPELDAFTPIVGRQREVSWMRGAWRIARRGTGRLVFVSGPAGVGKTRLVAALAAEIAARASGHVRYAGPGGAAAANALSALRASTTATEPTLIVLDDLDSLGDAVLNQLALSADGIEELPVLIVSISREPTSLAALSTLIERENVEGDGHRTLGPLGSDAVVEIARLYIEDPTDLPFDAMLRASGGLPGRLHELVVAWARDEANRRVEAAAQWLTAGRGELRRTELRLANNAIGLKLARLYAADAAGTIAGGGSPYLGLASFGADDASYFFGRERLVGDLAARLVGTGMLGVVGASGSGKSSVVAAGLIPSLTAGLLPGSERWRQALMRPGEHPMSALDIALEEKGGDPGTLTQVIDRLGPTGRLILVVDQFEEIFTACTDEEERSAFVEALTTAAISAPERLGVVVAIRGDLYERCSAYPALAELLGSTQVLVGPMNTDELRRAIDLPARRAGLRVESALTDALVAEVTDEPGGLPLLSTALLELWQSRKDGWLRLDAYEATGGVTGAVARLAEAAYGSLGSEEQEAAKAILLRLAGQGEDQGVVRRRAPLAEFDVDSHPEVERAMTVLIADRLLTVGEGRVEVAHEALLREWPRLRGWLEEDADGRAVHRSLIAAAGQWDTSGRDDAELYRGARLGAALDFSSEHGRDLNELERSFVAESREASERESRRIRRTNRRLRGSLVAVAVFLVVALVGAGLALVQRGRAERSATVALSQNLGAKGVAEPQLDIALLLAEEGLNLDNSIQTQSDLLSTLLHSPSAIAVLHGGTARAAPQALAVSPDGLTLAVVDGVDTLRFYDTTTHQAIGQPVHNVASGVRIPDFTPDGSELAVLRGRGVQLIDVRTQEVVRRIGVGLSVDESAEDNVWSPVLLSRDGRVVYVMVRSRLEAFDTSSGRLLARTDVPGQGVSCQGFALAPRAREIVTLSPQGGGRLQVRNGGTLALERSFPVPVAAPPGCTNFALAVSPDGRTAVYSSSWMGEVDESLRFVDLRTGNVRVGFGPQAGGGFVAVSPDGRTAISETDDYLHISVWDVSSRTVVQTLSGVNGVINHNAFDPSGRTLYSAILDGSVFEWNLAGTRSLGRSFSVGPGSDHGAGFVYPYFSASSDGSSIAVPYARHLSDGTTRGGGVNIVDLANGHITTKVPVAGRVPGVGSVSYAEFSPDGTELLVSPGPSSNGDITLWRLDHGPPSLVRIFSGLSATPVPPDLSFHEAPWATFSPDGSWIVGVDRRKDGHGRMIEWNARTGVQRAAPLDLRWKSIDGQVSQNVVYSPDGSLIATSVMGDEIAIVDASTLQLVRRLPDPQGVAFVAFSPVDQRLLAEGSAAGSIRLWDVTSGEQIAQVSASGWSGLWSIQFDPTGRMLLTEANDFVGRLWSVPGLQRIGSDLPGHPSTTGAATFAGRGDSTMAVLVTSTGQAFAYQGSLNAWERQACLVAGRNFTQAEWDQYLPSRPYSKVCPDEA